MTEVRDTRGAAECLGLSPATLATRRVRGGGPVFTKIGSRVVYRVADLETWLAEQPRQITTIPRRRKAA